MHLFFFVDRIEIFVLSSGDRSSAVPSVCWYATLLPVVGVSDWQLASIYLFSGRKRIKNKVRHLNWYRPLASPFCWWPSFKTVAIEEAPFPDLCSNCLFITTIYCNVRTFRRMLTALPFESISLDDFCLYIRLDGCLHRSVNSVCYTSTRAYDLWLIDKVIS